MNAVVISKADSGASQHYFKNEDVPVISNCTKTQVGPTVSLPDGTSMQATKTGNLELSPLLSKKATAVHVFKGIQNSSLLSIGQLCDDDCVAVLKKKDINIYKDDKVIISGTRNFYDGLWDVEIPVRDTTVKTMTITPTHTHNRLCAGNSPVETNQNATVTQKLNAIIRKAQTKQELVQYLHGCCGSTTLATWAKAIKNGNFITWPGINDIKVLQDGVPSVATAKGHLDQERKNLQSTKKQEDDYFPLPDTPNTKTYQACATLVAFIAKGMAYHDLTGKFPHISSRGYQ